MRVSTMVMSLAAHGSVAIALLQTPAAGRPHRPPPAIVLPPVARQPVRPSAPLPRAPDIGADDLPLPILPVPAIDPFGSPSPTVAWDSVRGRFLAREPRGTVGATGVIDGAHVEEPPVLLAGPGVAYPELLRQAGIQARVVLEAVVDTLGRVEPGSIVVVTAGHAPFAAAAIRALARSVFRPGRMSGRAVRVRVRIPFDFALRTGSLPE